MGRHSETAGFAREKSILLSAFAERMPDPVQTLLLRACLSRPPEANRSWRQWCERVGDPVEAIHIDRSSLKGLVPLIDHAVRSKSLDSDSDLTTHLRVAHVREEMRNAIYYRVYREILTLFRERGVKTLTIKACAVANTVYPEPGARHNHAIDLLVTDAGFAKACDTLASHGFRASDGKADGQHRVFLHNSGLAVGIHTRLFRNPYFMLDHDRVWLRSVPVEIAGVQAMVLSPTDQMLHTCGHASYAASSRSHRWICDAAFLVLNGNALAHESLMKEASRAQMCIPLLACMEYLRNDLGLPVSRDFLDGLSRRVSAGDRSCEEAAFFSATAFSKASTRRVVGRMIESWPTRISLFKYVVFPSSIYMRWKYTVSSTWMLPVFYTYRLLNMPRRILQILSHPVWRQKADART